MADFGLLANQPVVIDNVSDFFPCINNPSEHLLIVGLWCDQGGFCGRSDTEMSLSQLVCHLLYDFLLEQIIMYLITYLCLSVCLSVCLSLTDLSVCPPASPSLDSIALYKITCVLQCWTTEACEIDGRRFRRINFYWT